MSEWHDRRIEAARRRYEQITSDYRKNTGRRRELDRARQLAKAEIIRREVAAGYVSRGTTRRAVTHDKG